MKRHLLISFSLLLFVCGAKGVTANEQQKLTGDEIIEKHLQAVGGRAALTKFKSRVALGTVKKENEPEAPMAIMSEAPNRLSVYYGFADYSLYMIYDGGRAYFRPPMPRQLANLVDKYQEITASGLMFNDISLYNLLVTSAPGTLKFEAKGMKKVNDRQAYVVQVKPPKGSVMRLYFDAENFMWVRTDYGKASVTAQLGPFTNDIVNQGGSELTIDFYIETSDFREVQGLKLPFKFQQVMTAPILKQSSMGTITGTIREYQHDIKIDPKMFQ